MNSAPLAIAFGGGGARAAYQVGCLRWLARRAPRLRLPILTGVSMGAINAVHLARSTAPFSESVAGLASLWSRLTTDRVARSDWTWPGGLVLRSLGGALGMRRTFSRPLAPLDTRPLRAFLASAFGETPDDIPGIAENLRTGALSGVALTTTDLSSGCSTTWVQASPPIDWQEEMGHRGITSTLGLDHLMATMAVPFLFPAVRLGDSWHADGVIRQSDPLMPAVKLGAGRILSISSRHVGARAPASPANDQRHPDPGRVGGILLNSILESMLDVNVRRLEEMRALAGRLPEQDRPGVPPAHALVLRPSRDLGAMAVEHHARLPRSSRWLARRLGTADQKNLDLFSNYAFEPHFISALIELGEMDCESRACQIESFIAAD